MDINNINNKKINIEEKTDNYQVLITNIKWNPNSILSYRSKKDSIAELPEQFSLDIPEGKIKQAIKMQKKENNIIAFKDIIETYCYDFLTHKFCHEVYSCSIWLPFNEENI